MNIVDGELIKSTKQGEIDTLIQRSNSSIETIDLPDKINTKEDFIDWLRSQGKFSRKSKII